MSSIPHFHKHLFFAAYIIIISKIKGWLCAYQIGNVWIQRLNGSTAHTFLFHASTPTPATDLGSERKRPGAEIVIGAMAATEN